MGQLVTLRIDEGVAELTIDRPKALNALNMDVLKEMLGALGDALAAEPAALIVSGAGERAFAAGADIAQMSEFDETDAAAFAQLGQLLMTNLDKAPFVTIAAVEGYALGGGCELALACDFVVASEKAVFGQPEVRLGLIPGFGGTQRLPRKIGRSAAAYMILTGERIDAQTAHHWGLVARLTPPGKALEEARRLARIVADKTGPLAVATAKQVMRQGLRLSLIEGLGMEIEEFSDLFDTKDAREGMAAFLDKRPAQFSGE